MVRESGAVKPPPPGVLNNDSNSDSESGSDKTSATSKSRPTVRTKMLNAFKEITLMLVVATVYTAFTTETSPKISKSPAAYPFFPKESPVLDWYRGQLTEAIEKARGSDMAFVMYYAPWDAESRAARAPFEEAAHLMHHKVSFAAINCWQPGSECKRQYSKVYRWPVLIAYPTHGRGIQYNGPLESTHMVKFLENMCMPLERAEEAAPLLGTTAKEGVVIANLDTLPGSYEYAVFYAAALRFLEKDPFREIPFLVQTQHPDLEPGLKLGTWNETIVYGGNWTPDGISAWVLKNFHQVMGWIALSGTKSNTLASYIQPGPALILFTPKNPLYPYNDYYEMLKEIATEYNNCKIDDEISQVDISIDTIRIWRLKGRLDFEKIQSSCSLHEPTMSNKWTNWTETPESCRCTSLGQDRLSSTTLLHTVQSEKCRLFRLSQQYFPTFFKDTTTDKSANVTGLGCRNNQSLVIFAMDSLRHYHFAERLGINLADNPQKSAIVIVNEKMETHHVMDAPLNGLNVRNFIRNFSTIAIERALGPPQGARPRYSHHQCETLNGQFCLRELTSRDFLQTVLVPHKALVIFYYSKQCAFCSGISNVFLTVAKLFSTVEDLEFVRIDGDINLLPWEYTMESYPTILFVPTIRKSESRALPMGIPVNITNLVGFILTNLERGQKLTAMWAICSAAKFEEDAKMCITSVRTETLSTIHSLLQEWRRVNARRKGLIFHKLQLLRQLHLLLAYSPEKVSEVQQYLSRFTERTKEI